MFIGFGLTWFAEIELVDGAETFWELPIGASYREEVVRRVFE